MGMPLAGLLRFAKLIALAPVHRLCRVLRRRIDLAAFRKALLSVILLPGSGPVALAFIFLDCHRLSPPYCHYPQVTGEKA
jgi:hypothetical protein